MRLHEACGSLFLYFAQYNRLPPDVNALKNPPGGATLGVTPGATDLTCPVSHKPYIYNPTGIPAPKSPAILVLYDPEPSHHGYRWAVAVIPPEGNNALIADVIAVPESYFKKFEK